MHLGSDHGLHLPAKPVHLGLPVVQKKNDVAIKFGKRFDAAHWLWFCSGSGRSQAVDERGRSDCKRIVQIQGVLPMRLSKCHALSRS